MKKRMQMEVGAPRILRFVTEGRHRKTPRSVVDAHSTLSGCIGRKPVVGVFAYSYTVSFKWLTPSSATNPFRNGAPAVTCPCGTGV